MADNNGLTAAEFATLFRLPPADAMAWMRGRAQAAVTYSWQDLWLEEHSRHFTISRLARLDLLQAFHDGISRSVAGDLSRRDWIRDYQQLLQQAGWWGDVEVVDPVSGEVVTTRFNLARLHLIYDTNTRQAAARGQWERIQRAKASHPYLVFLTMDDERVRPLHASWHGLALPVDHPFWLSHFPPCGWRCRCRVIAITQEEYDRGVLPNGVKMIKTAPETIWRDFVNRRTGEISQVPLGVDPGFGSIPAQGERLRLLDGLVAEKLKSAIPAIAASARYEGMTLETSAATFAEKVRLSKQEKQPPLILAPIAEAALGQLRALDLPMSKKVPLDAKMLGLDHDGVRHAWLKHGALGPAEDIELARGQVPITAADMAAFSEIFNRAELILGNPPKSSDGATIVTGKSVFGGYRYEFAAKVGRYLVTPYTLYKWAI